MGISVKLPNFLPACRGRRRSSRQLLRKSSLTRRRGHRAGFIRFAKMPDEVPATGISCSKPLPCPPKRLPRQRPTENRIGRRPQGKWENPYDPDEVTLDAFVTDTDGKTYTMPGFYMVPMRIREIEGNEIIGYGGNGTWKVRLTAFKPGELRVKLVAKDSTGSVEYTLPNPITITASKERGFVRVSPIDPHYFIHDNGETHLPIGHNIPIYRAGEFGHLKGIQLMAENGENWNRWWLNSYGLGLEWEEGLVRYRQKQAAQVDHVLDAAEKYDFYYMMCLDTHQDFRQQGWKDNPYNKANGGPCENVVDCYQRRSRQNLPLRLRYQVARRPFPAHSMLGIRQRFEGWAPPTKTIIEWHRKNGACLGKSPIPTTTGSQPRGGAKYNRRMLGNTRNGYRANTLLHQQRPERRQANNRILYHAMEQFQKAAYLRRIRHSQPFYNSRQGSQGLGASQRQLGGIDDRMQWKSNALVARKLHRAAQPLLPFQGIEKLRQRHPVRTRSLRHHPNRHLGFQSRAHQGSCPKGRRRSILRGIQKGKHRPIQNRPIWRNAMQENYSTVQEQDTKTCVHSRLTVNFRKTDSSCRSSTQSRFSHLKSTWTISLL